MGKLDDLKKAGFANARESMGVFSDASMQNTAPAAMQVAGPSKHDGVSRERNVCAIPLSKIDRDPHQPREEFEEESLGRLAESLKQRGQLQPIRVRWDDALGLYVIVCGERRWRAARMAGLSTISAVVMEGAIDLGE